MLAAFQGFTTPHGDKKTRQDVQVIYQQFLWGKRIPGAPSGQSLA